MGGAGEVQKKHSRKGKLNEKNSCTPINPKKYSCNGLNKIHAKNLITKKNSCSSKIPPPPPPITFLMVRPLGRDKTNVTAVLIRDCAIITWRGGEKLEGAIGENDNKREGGLDGKFNTYRGWHYFFIPFCKLEK